MAGMQTPDGKWVVEIYRRPHSTSWWYRLRRGENVVEDLSIGSVERILAEAGYDLADLQDSTEVTGVTEGEHGAA